MQAPFLGMVAADGSRLLPDSCTRHGCIGISSLLGRRWIGFLDGFQWCFGKVVGGGWLGCQSYLGMMSGEERVGRTDRAPQNDMCQNVGIKSV